jgi:hypothetical protein
MDRADDRENEVNPIPPVGGAVTARKCRANCGQSRFDHGATTSFL